MIAFSIALLIPFAYGFYLTLMHMTTPVSPLQFSGTIITS